MEPAPPGTWPLVAVVILNWNHKDHVLALLDSLRDTTYPKVRMGIFLCDNASTDGSSDILPDALESLRAAGWRDLVYIPNAVNIGFGGGNNSALREVPREYSLLFLANDDLLVFPDTFQPLVETMESAPRASAVGPRVLEFLPSDAVAHAAGFINTWLCRATWRESDTVIPCDFLTGCALMLRRSALEPAGGLFDERYFAYWEDTDLCLRLRKAGGRVLYCPESQVRHKGGASTGDSRGDWRTPARLYYETHGRTLFARTHLGLPRLAVYLALFTLRIPVLALRTLASRPADTLPRLQACLRGLHEGLLGRKAQIWKSIKNE